MSILESISQFFNEGGFTMYITATAGAFGFAVAIERGVKLFKDYNKNSPLFMARVKELLIQNRFEDAVQFCAGEKGLLPPIVKSGMERMGCDDALVRQSMETSFLEQVPKITERLGYISLIANTSMLFGLLGTVLGLIRQFSAVASADAAQKQLLMAKGIAESMNNTALGLMIALPCLIIQGIYASKASKLVEDLERGSSQFLDWMGLHNYGQLQQRLSSDRRPLKKVAEV